LVAAFWVTLTKRSLPILYLTSTPGFTREYEGRAAENQTAFEANESSKSKTKISREANFAPSPPLATSVKDAKPQRFETKTDFRPEATDISVASRSSFSKFPRLGNARQNERNVVAVVQRPARQSDETIHLSLFTLFLCVFA
jgi:hypothetical protein